MEKVIVGRREYQEDERESNGEQEYGEGEYDEQDSVT